MPQILNNTGVKLWSKDDYSELWLSVFEELTGTAGKSNIRLIDEAIGNINASLDGYYFLYENNRLYICKDNENSTEKFPLQLVSSDGKIVSSVDGTTITIDENGVLHGTTVDSAFSLTSENPIQNKVVKEKIDDMDKQIAQNATDVESLETVISSHISDSNNPHHISKTQIGLANVEDKSSETIRNEITKDNVTTALGYTPYTPNEIDNKFSSVETNISWKESVETFNDIATIYPNPSDGWTVNVNDTDYTYRYDGSEWIAISANSIPKATNNVDGLLSKEDHSSYDDAVSKAHAHDNKSVLGKLGESEEGTLTFNGSAIMTNTDFVANTKDEAQAAIDAGLVDNGATVYVRDDGENTSSVTQEQIVEIAKQQIELYMENDGSTIINNVIDSKIGNGTITIRQGNVEKDSFTTNQNSDTIINLDANTGLPSVSESDNGKYLKVDNGQWVVSEMPSISYKEETNESGGITAIIGGNESGSDTPTEPLEPTGKIYGISRDITQENPSWTRTDDAVGLTATASVGTTAGHSDFDNILPWGGMKRETLDTGDVVVKIPKFYFQRYLDGNIEHIRICDSPLEGFSLHRAFNRPDKEREYIYVGAYKTSDNNKSESGGSITYCLSRSMARERIKSKGSGWSMVDMSVRSAIQMLILVEFAHNDTQALIGDGVVNASSAINTGTCDNVPNLTGRPSGESNKSDVVWRGIEGLWGNLLELTDGVNFYIPEKGVGEYYVCNDPTKYYDGGSSGYTRLSYNPGHLYSMTYIKEVGLDTGNREIMLPSKTAGLGGNYYCDGADYPSSPSDVGLWYTVMFGGNFNSLDKAGIFDLDFSLNEIPFYPRSYRLLWMPV